MTKQDIVERLFEKVGFTKKESSDLIDHIFDIIKNALAEDKDVKISDFGNFKIRKKNKRMGRNPKTGKEIEISERTVVTFKPSQKLKEYVNGRRNSIE